MSVDHQPATAPVTTRRIAAVGGGAAAALAVWVLSGPIAGVDLTVRTGGTAGPVGPVAVAAAALVAGLAGWALLALLERITARAGRIWTVTAAVLLVASLTGPLAAAVSGPAGILALAAMHLATGAVLISGLPRRGVPWSARSDA